MSFEHCLVCTFLHGNVLNGKTITDPYGLMVVPKWMQLLETSDRLLLVSLNCSFVVMGFFVEQVIVAASERCLDVIPLEPPILDKLIQAKLAKGKEQNPAAL